MKMTSGILALFCVAILNFGISTAEYKLEHVVVTYRSLEHTPCDFPNGPKITGNPESGSTLTTQGVENAYNLGNTLGDKYKNDFGISSWTDSDYYSMGTRTPRSLMSALNVGAGLENQASKKVINWNEEERKKAHEFPYTDQYVKFLKKSECPAFFKALQEEMQKLTSKLSTYATKLQKVTTHYSDVNMNAPQNFWIAYETLSSQNASGQTPSWVTQDIWDALKGFSHQFLLGAESTTNLKHLSGGIMVDSILNITETIKKGENPAGKDKNHNHKMSLLAVPQGSLGAMIGAFSPEGTKYNGKEFNSENFYPNNGAHHVVEIYKKGENTNSDVKVRVLYSNGNGTALAPLKYSACGDGDMCTYEQLKEALGAIRLPGSQQDEECQKVKSKAK